MEIIFMFVIGLLVLLVAALAIVKGVSARVKESDNRLTERMAVLEEKVEKLEKTH